MFDFSTMNIFGGDNKTLLWVGLGLMVVAIAVYVYMTRKPVPSQSQSASSMPLAMESCQVHPSESFQHPSEQQPTQITCMVTDSGEQVCGEEAMPLLNADLSVQ